jgi:glyoxylase-like metal-dependent hydrolase (beta-lactamase superfamily II)
VVIDPGPADPGHLAAVARQAPGGLILLTHGHPDHVDGVPDLAAATGGQVRGLMSAYQSATDPLAGGQMLLADGFEITVLATPGHTSDSACFLVERDGEQVIFTGDTILGRGTTVVAHPDGDLGDYLDSLDLLSAYDGVSALPGHGPALADCAAAARFYLAHRRARLDQVRRAVAEGAETADQVVAAVYADVDRALWPAAGWSVRAQLAYLRRENRESGAGPVRLDSP